MNAEIPSPDALCHDFLVSVASQYPIATASDEFYYFPQAKFEDTPWRRWDAFSNDTIDNFAKELSGYEAVLEEMIQHDRTVDNKDTAKRINISLMQRMLVTLREQLTEVRSWERQPTFHLTIACLGIAEALESEDPAAAHDRVKHLPAFLHNAGTILKNVPELFRNLGLEMIRDTRKYFIRLDPKLPDLKTTLAALDQFEESLRRLKTQPHCQLPRHLVDRVIRFHMNCDLDLDEIDEILVSEIHAMQSILKHKATTMYRVGSWQQAVEKIDMPHVPGGDLVKFYQNVVETLAHHCLQKGILSKTMLNMCPVRVEPVPSFLSATRTASSYSVQPKHPPSGGIFYVIRAKDPQEPYKAYQREHRILSAHETYPGHHFLDSFRLNLKSCIRRSIEKPLFYEGWACFAEDLLRITGYFSGTDDTLLLAKRRLWRATRGRIDLGLQTGNMDMSTAIEYLVKIGQNRKNASAVVRKYPLNPGYQLCYTLGLRRFLQLYDDFGVRDLIGFVETIMAQGEIDFDDLRSILIQKS